MTGVAVLGATGPASLLATVLSEDPEIEAVSRAGLGNPAAALQDVEIVVGIGSADPAQEQSAALAATGAGVPYVSAAGSPEVVQALTELNRRLETDGALVIAGMSWTPGITNMMVARAGRELDAVEAVEVSWVVSSEGPMAQAALATAAECLHGRALTIAGGALRAEPAGSSPKEVFFPEPVGWRKIRVVRNAETAMLDRGPSAPEAVVVRGALASSAVNAVLRTLPGGARWEDAVGRNPKALSILGKLTSGGPWSGLRVDVSGTRNGSAATLTYGLVDQLPNLVVNPALVAVKLLRRAKPAVSGVVSPEEVFAPEEFFAELGARGVRVATLERVH